MQGSSRRQFLKQAAAASASAATWLSGCELVRRSAEKPGAGIRYGLVTYLWGRDWDLPTLIANCEKTGVFGVELRTTHAHGVEPGLNAAQRAEVRKRFDDSPVTLVGLGSNERFCNPNSETLRKALEASKEFVVLSHDVGGSGVKVKPDKCDHEGVPKAKTIEQIGEALNELGQFAEGYGQQIRLEVHGSCGDLPTIKEIIDIADHPNVAVCWNSNKKDLEGEGLQHNFDLVKDRFGQTAHIHLLESEEYPHAKLIELFVAMDYEGWLMLEEGSKPPLEKRVGLLLEQRQRFDVLLAEARAKA